MADTEAVERCEQCGLPIVECSALAIGRMEIEKWLRDEGYSPLRAKERAAALTCTPPIDVEAVARALEAGLEYAIDAANECKQKDHMFDQIMSDVRRIEAAIAAMCAHKEIG